MLAMGDGTEELQMAGTRLEVGVMNIRPGETSALWRPERHLLDR